MVFILSLYIYAEITPMHIARPFTSVHRQPDMLVIDMKLDYLPVKDLDVTAVLEPDEGGRYFLSSLEYDFDTNGKTNILDILTDQQINDLRNEALTIAGEIYAN